jgi:hypothetical protein
VIYARDVTAGESVRRKIGTVANPGAGLTTTYDVTSNNWTSGVEAPTDHTVPPLLSFGVVWKNRWWGGTRRPRTGCTLRRFSSRSRGRRTFYIDIPFERGDNIAAMLPLGRYAARVRAEQDFPDHRADLAGLRSPAERRESGRGAGPRAVDALEKARMHASADGIYLFDGATDRLLSYDVDGFSPTAIGWRSYVTTATSADLERRP